MIDATFDVCVQLDLCVLVYVYICVCVCVHPLHQILKNHYPWCTCTCFLLWYFSLSLSLVWSVYYATLSVCIFLAYVCTVYLKSISIGKFYPPLSPPNLQLLVPVGVAKVGSAINHIKKAFSSTPFPSVFQACWHNIPCVCIDPPNDGLSRWHGMRNGLAQLTKLWSAPLYSCSRSSVINRLPCVRNY